MQEMKSIENMSFEEALAELELIVRKIDTGEENLEDSIASFERGVALKKYCEKKLAEAKLKIEKVTKLADDSLSTEEISV